jgi:hypothetical protein
MTPDTPSKQKIARAKVDPARRKEIAAQGAKARWEEKPDRCAMTGVKFNSTDTNLRRRIRPSGEHVLAMVNKMMKDCSNDTFITICKLVAKRHAKL